MCAWPVARSTLRSRAFDALRTSGQLVRKTVSVIPNLLSNQSPLRAACVSTRLGEIPNQVLTHDARAAASQALLALMALLGSARLSRRFAFLALAVNK